MASSKRKLILMTVIPLCLVAGASIYFYLTAQYVATDNAYIKQDKVSVSAEVSGLIVEVKVSENQHVAAGEMLFRIDPRPYHIAVDEAKTAIIAARARLREDETSLASARVDIESAVKDIEFYEREFERQSKLLKNKMTSEANLQTAEHALIQARARLSAAQAEAIEAESAIDTAEAEIARTEVQLEKAQLNLDRTEVRAPVAGIISQSSRLQTGQLMMQALPAVTVVVNERSWVEANFKETDLEYMHVGQPVEIEVDTFSDTLMHGHVESIGAGTGSEFSILPAQNANANWVKVTQRIPVRISIEDAPSRPLLAGLSATVRVDTSD